MRERLFSTWPIIDCPMLLNIVYISIPEAKKIGNSSPSMDPLPKAIRTKQNASIIKKGSATAQTYPNLNRPKRELSSRVKSANTTDF